ncbi:hypothetical protein [Luedemannella helvata]|uniref:DNA-binding protein n=1 Tax=Luedemannella helvata TaxID=349315 RepID=A0ABN2KJ63_9ACTN
MQDFSLRVARMLTAAELDAVLGGHDDMVVARDPDTPGARIWVRRAAPTPLDAMLSAIRDLDVLGLPPVGAIDEDLVTVNDIADRTGRSRTAVRLWVSVAPGRGRFPEPAVAGPPTAWRWTEVADWLRLWLGLAPDGHEPVLSAVDLALRLRALAPRVTRMAAIRDLVPRGGDS